MRKLGSSCDACGGTLRRKSEWVFECPSCGLLISSLSPGARTGIEGLEVLRRSNFERLLDRLERLRPLSGARLLEVGSAWGWFLEAAARRGALMHGIEPEAANAAITRAAGLSVEEGYFPSGLTKAGPYDIVVFNDVFEHIPSPSALMADIEARLAPGGLLVLNLPSSNGTIYRLALLLDRLGMHGPLERLWQKGFPSPHVSYFNPANLQLLVEKHSSLRKEASFSLIGELLGKNLDMVTGLRVSAAKEAYRLGHRFGNTLLTGTVRKLFGDRFLDMLSGYRVFSRRFVKSFPALAVGFEIETELTIHALELRMPIAEIPAQYRGRPEGSASKLRTFRDGFRILLTIAALVKRERPHSLFGWLCALLICAALVLGTPIVNTYFETGLVPRLPTAVLATGLVLLGFLSLACGLILDTVTLGRREMKRLSYLQHRACGRDDG